MIINEGWCQMINWFPEETLECGCEGERESSKLQSATKLLKVKFDRNEICNNLNAEGRRCKKHV